MKFLLMVYVDDTLLDALPPGEYDARMRHCIANADALREQGCLLDAQQLEAPATAKAVRIRGERTMVVDGPFAETKELVAGFWLWQVRSMDEAVEWVRRCPNPFEQGESVIEIRPLYEAEDLGDAFTPELRESEERLRAELASKPH